MDFLLTDKHQQWRQTVRNFAAEKLAPFSVEWDADHHFPKEALDQMAAMGLMGVTIPEAYGGLGLDYLSYAIAVEEVARADPACSVIMSVNNSLICGGVMHHGTDQNRQDYLSDLATGQRLGCFCLTEPQAGSDAANLASTARLEGDHYVLNGSKIFITSGGHAAIALLMAMTDKSQGKKGISSFLIETDSEGFSFGPPEHKLGLNASHTTTVTMDQVKVPVGNRLGEEGNGYKLALGTLNSGRIGIGAQAIGIAQGAYDEALAFYKEQFQSKTLSPAQQAMEEDLADMATRVEASRLLVYQAAWLKENDKPCIKEAAMAKLYASETSHFCVDRAMQIMAPHSYTQAYRVEQFWRDARVTEIYEGTSEVQRLVIARQLLKD